MSPITVRRLAVGAAVTVLAVAAVVAGTIGGAAADPKPMIVAGCKAELASMMRDPESVEIADMDELEFERGDDPPHGWIVSGEYRARNGFGGMNSDRFVCATDPDGGHPAVVTHEMMEDLP